MTANPSSDSSWSSSVYANHSTDQVFNDKLESIFVGNSSNSSRVEAFVRRGWPSAVSDDKESKLWQQGSTKNALAAERNSIHARPNIALFTSEEEVEQYVKYNQGFGALFIKQRNSFSPLSVSPRLFEAIRSQINISSRFADFILHLGEKESEIEIAPPPAWLKSGYLEATTVPVSLELMCGIRFVELNDRNDAQEPSSQWSLRQCAVYYRQDMRKQMLSWVLVSISPVARQDLLQHWSSRENPVHSSLLEGLRILYGAAVCNWRPYLVSLTTEVDQHAAKFLGTSLDGEGPVQAIGYNDRQALLVLENKILAAGLAVRATRNDLALLQREFNIIRLPFSPSTNIELGECETTLDYFVRDLDTNFMRLEQLLSKLQSMTKLVSSFLDLSNGTALQQISTASRYESETMRKLNERMAELAEKSSQDSATVTVLTTLTLIYLPITVVSNFFSTSFVGTQDTSNRIYITQDWWILFVTAIPLTVLTLYVWWVWSRIKASRTYPSWWPRSRIPDREVGLKATASRSFPPDHEVSMCQTAQQETHLPGRYSWGQSL